MSKNKTIKNHYHNINGLKGKELQTKIAKQVDGENWKSGHTHHFYCSSGSSRTQGRDRGQKTAIVIKPKPTPNQPGNGIVKIRDEASSWSALKPVVKNKRFPKSREKYLEKPVDSSSFKTKSSQANFLLDFEIARRKPMKSDESSYPLTRSQVKRGISAAVSKPDQNYSEKVVFRIYFVYFKISLYKNQKF